MRMVKAALAGVAVYLASSLPAWAQPAPYVIDREHAHFAFMVSHIGFARTMGEFREVEGRFTFDEAAMTVSDVKVTIKTASVDTNHDKRDAHLRKKDFFWTDEHPTMTFVGTKAERTGERTGKLTGDLTLRGVTRPVTFDLTLNKTGRYPFGDKHYAVGASARGQIKRSDFGMTYAVADGLVGDVVDIVIEFEGIRQE